MSRGQGFDSPWLHHLIEEFGQPEPNSWAPVWHPRKWAAIERPKSREETPKEGVPQEYREAVAQMRGVLLPHDHLFFIKFSS